MKKKGNILIIDDNEAMLVSLRMLLKNVCEDVQTSTNPNAIPTLMRRKKPDVVLLDMNFGRGINNGNEGMFWLKEIKRLEPDVAVVLFTAYADIDLAVRQELIHECLFLIEECICIAHGTTKDSADDIPCLGIAWQLSVGN